ncbi:MAG: hypothetical protein ABS77_12895 [Phenylobacterium sp. SCN 69-14]|nr:MAG: hypothetical protein ABS77_12895 [Phenylobacterium sp. SCN 69-14]
MILTCPDCATSYFVEDSKIPADGRLVKCANCGARWTASLDQVEAPAPPSPPEPEAAFAPDPAAAEIEEAPVRELSGEDLSKAFRAKADTERKVREAAATGVIWAGMAAALVLILALAVIFRVDVVRLWPRTASAYAGVGLPVNSLGLVIEGVRFEPSLQEGHAALAVSGMIRNIENEPVVAPPLRISLLDAEGKALATKIARPADARIPPGETRHFAIALLDPPARAKELEVAFAPREPLGVKVQQSDPAPAARSQAPALRPAAAPAPPPMVMEAQPLAPGSPDALPAPAP